MAKIKITRPTVCGGRHVAVDAIVEASESDARYLCAIGKAVPANETDAQAKVNAEPEAAAKVEADVKVKAEPEAAAKSAKSTK